MTSQKHQIFVCFLARNVHVDCLL